MKAKSRILIFLFSFFLANGAYWYDVENIVPKDLKNIEFSVIPEATFLDGEVSWEIKILKDVEITFSSKSFDETSKIVLNLKDSLIPNSSYNLLSVFWVDWNIDFNLWDELNLVDIANPENIVWIQWISRLVIFDSKTIEVYFNDPIDSTEFEFKLFRESKVEYINNEAGKLSLTLNDNLDKSSNYLLMLISLKDSSWTDLQFEEEIYDFVTTDTLWEKSIDIMDTFIKSDNGEIIPTLDGIVDNNLNTALEWSENTMSWELNTVALNAAVTPKSWPETWILILLTILVNIFIFARKKFSK